MLQCNVIYSFYKRSEVANLHLLLSIGLLWICLCMIQSIFCLPFNKSKHKFQCWLVQIPSSVSALWMIVNFNIFIGYGKVKCSTIYGARIIFFHFQLLKWYTILIYLKYTIMFGIILYHAVVIKLVGKRHMEKPQQNIMIYGMLIECQYIHT